MLTQLQKNQKHTKTTAATAQKKGSKSFRLQDNRATSKTVQLMEESHEDSDDTDAIQMKVKSETTQLQEVTQLGKKSRKKAATERNKKKREKKKKQEHTKNARPSSRAKHQKGQAAKKSSVEDSAFRAYKRRGGRLAKSAWRSAGMPTR